MQRFFAASTSPSPSDAGERWVNIGPAPLLGGQIGTQIGTRPMSGRVGDLAVDPSNSNHWLVGTAGGGLWETRNAGTIWIPRTDDQPAMAFGAVAFAPGSPNIIYAGTGEAVFISTSYGGGGLLKSTNGGTNWVILAASTFTNLSFSELKVNPTNSNHVIAATTYGLRGRNGEFAPTLGNRGLFTSTTGGTNWIRRLTGEATDLEAHPSNFDWQFAALGQIFGQPTNGLYRTTNAWQTWTRIDGPWIAEAGGVGRVELAIAPSNPNVLYVSIQDAFNSVGHDGGLLGLWRSTNAWEAGPIFTRIPTGATDDGSGIHGFCGWAPGYNADSHSCSYAQEIIVDPTDANTLYAGGVPLWRFDGTNWVEISKNGSNPANGIKVDQHAMAWAGTRLIVGNDGGVWSTLDRGNTWLDHNTTLATLQFYSGSLHPTNPNFALGASQDNGTEKWAGTNSWRLFWGGDGAANAISAGNPDLHFAFSAQNLEIFRTKNAGTNLISATSGLDRTGAAFVAPLEIAPSDNDTLIAGADNLWKCTNFFSALTPTWFSNGPEMGAAITALAYARSDLTSRSYAFGTANGQLRITTNEGLNWINLDAANTVPNRYITDLGFHPTNANILYASLSGFDESTPGQPGHVFRTANALAPSPVWSNRSPPVNLPHNTLEVHPTNGAVVYVGTDIGLWRSTNAGTNWRHMGPATGLPYVPVFDIKISPDGRRTVAFTHGRSAFALVSALRIISIELAPGQVQIRFPSGPGQRYRLERSE